MDRLRLLVNVARLTTNIAHGCGIPDLMLTLLDMTFPANAPVLINLIKFSLSIQHAVSLMQTISRLLDQSGVRVKEDKMTMTYVMNQLLEGYLLRGIIHMPKKITKTTSLTHITVEAPARLTPMLDMTVLLVRVLTFFTVILLDSV